MAGPRFDTTISLGTIIQVIVLIGGGIALAAGMQSAVTSLDTRVSRTEERQEVLDARVDQMVPALATTATNVEQLQGIAAQQLTINREIQQALTDIARELGVLSTRIGTGGGNGQ